VVIGGRRGVARFERDLVLAPPPRRFCPQVIGHPADGDLDEPSTRVLGQSLGGPLLRRGDERLLDRVLRRGEIAEAADDRAENLRRQLAQQALAGKGGHTSTGGPLMTSRTSIGMLSGLPPGPGAAEARAAIS